MMVAGTVTLVMLPSHYTFSPIILCIFDLDCGKQMVMYCVGVQDLQANKLYCFIFPLIKASSIDRKGRKIESASVAW